MAYATNYRLEFDLITRLLGATPPVSALYSKFWRKKGQNMLVWLSKIVVLAQHFCT